MEKHQLKIALVHDYIKDYGGAERVLETLHEMYPDAPVFTLVYCPEFLGPHRQRFVGWHIVPSILQLVPYNEKLISVFRLLAPLVFQFFDFSGFDVVIVSATGAYSPNMIRTNAKGKESSVKVKHICYCHTPPRYLYGYATARNWKRNAFLMILGEIANHFLRMMDYAASKHVDVFIANSKNVAGRIENFYRREAIVVYPPVWQGTQRAKDGEKERKTQQIQNYFLAGGRLARAKHYDLIVQACAELGLQLKIFGKGFAGYEEELRSMMNGERNSRLRSNNSVVEFVGEVTDEEKLKLMRNARAFIFAGEDEDFGIVPVEAMSVGTPVIAYRSGGVLETVIEGKTGVFFDELTVASLKDVMKRFEKMKFNPKTCMQQAEKFSKEKFIRGMEKIVQTV